MISRLTCLVTAGAVLLAYTGAAQPQYQPPAAKKAAWASQRSLADRGVANVVDFGAVGDGTTDNTLAFRDAMWLVHDEGGGVVKVPAGKFLIKEYLAVPERVTLEGVWRAPVRGIPYDGGATLLAVHGQGNENAEAFITLHSSSGLKGLTIFYPEQIAANPPYAYPWTVVGKGENCSLIDVMMVNPYKAVDFGSNPCSRHSINGLYSQALYRGVYIDQCYDVGRMQNIHFWPFWHVATSGPLYDFTLAQGVAFTIGRSDGQMGLNLFCIFYGRGFHFTDTGYGPGSGLYTHLYPDISPMAIKLDKVNPVSGISIVNSMIMATVEVGPGNQGPISFVGSGFWGFGQVRNQARLSGQGHVSFDSCQFSGWNRAGLNDACIVANNDGVSVTGCFFITSSSNQRKVELGASLNSAIVTMNRMQGGVIINNFTAAGADVQIGLNSGR